MAPHNPDKNITLCCVENIFEIPTHSRLSRKTSCAICSTNHGTMAIFVMAPRTSLERSPSIRRQLSHGPSQYRVTGYTRSRTRAVAKKDKLLQDNCPAGVQHVAPVRMPKLNWHYGLIQLHQCN